MAEQSSHGGRAFAAVPRGDVTALPDLVHGRLRAGSVRDRRPVLAEFLTRLGIDSGGADHAPDPPAGAAVYAAATNATYFIAPRRRIDGDKELAVAVVSRNPARQYTRKGREP